MTLATSLQRLAHRIRAIPGQMGIRPFRVYVVTRTWTDSPAGEGDYTDVETEITESGQPPKVRNVSGEEITINNLASDSIRIGPITPEHVGGGFDLDTLQATMTIAEERFVKVVGPGRESGVFFRVTDVNCDWKIHYTITAAPLAESA